MAATFIHFRNQSWDQIEYHNPLKERLNHLFPKMQYIDFDNDSGKDLLTNLKTLITESDQNILYLELNDQSSGVITSLLNHFARKYKPSDSLYFSGTLKTIEKMVRILNGVEVKSIEELLGQLKSSQL